MRDYGLSLRPDNCRTIIHYTRHPMPYTPSNPNLDWCCAPAFYNLCDISPCTQISTDGDPQAQGDEVRWPTVKNPQQRAAAKRGRARRFDLEDLPPVSMGGVPIRQPGDPEQDQEQVLIAGPLCTLFFHPSRAKFVPDQLHVRMHLMQSVACLHYSRVKDSRTCSAVSRPCSCVHAISHQSSAACRCYQ